jgi:hypothetical protein
MLRGVFFEKRTQLSQGMNMLDDPASNNNGRFGEMDVPLKLS